MLRGRARDNLADRARAGVEDVVKLELEERRRLRDRAVDADECGRVEIFGEEVGDERGDVRGLLRGLQRRRGVSKRSLNVEPQQKAP